MVQERGCTGLSPGLQAVEQYDYLSQARKSITGLPKLGTKIEPFCVAGNTGRTGLVQPRAAFPRRAVLPLVAVGLYEKIKCHRQQFRLYEVSAIKVVEGRTPSLPPALMEFRYMARFFSSLLGCVLALAFVSPAFAADKLRMGMEGGHPPFNDTDASGQVVGFDADIGNALCAKMKMECEIVTADFENLIPALNSNQFDFLISSLSITDERKQLVDFTDPYYINKLQFIAPESSDLSSAPGSFMGKILGAQLGTLAASWLQDNAANVATVQTFQTQDELYVALSTRQIDGALADKYSGYEWLRTDAGKGFELKGDPVEDGDRVAIATRLNDPLRMRLNVALKDIIQDGTYKKINDKYFPFSIR
jgi:polar amino acid transport system substrate-binding protein